MSEGLNDNDVLHRIGIELDASSEQAEAVRLEEQRAAFRDRPERRPLDQDLIPMGIPTGHIALRDIPEPGERQ